MFLLNLPILPNLPPYDARSGQSLLRTGKVDNDGHKGPRIITEADEPDDVSMDEMLGGKRQPHDDIKVKIKGRKNKKVTKK